MSTNLSDPCDARFQSFCEYPVRALIFLLKKMKLTDLLSRHISDPRTRIDRYSLTSLFMQALCIPLFRVSSKNEYHQHLQRPESIKSLAKLSGIDEPWMPCARTIDDLFLNINSVELQPILPAIFRRLIKEKIFQLHPELLSEGVYNIVIDAFSPHTYYEHSQHPCRCCPYCLKRTRGKQTWYLHSNVVASFVSPSGLQIPLFVHRIRARPEWSQLSDNRFKQECEQSAFPIILNQLRQEFPRLKVCILLDALYATDHNLTLLKEFKMGYAIVRKAKVLKTIGADCEGLKSLTPPVEHTYTDKRFTVHQTLLLFNDIVYREHSLSIIQLDEEATKKPSKRFAKVQAKTVHWEWIVHKKLNAANVIPIAAQSRLRWKGEDLFNSLNNRGFAVRHDFSRSPSQQTIWLYLALIAFAISSIFCYSSLGQQTLRDKSIRFVMQQMLDDLVYIAEDVLWNCCFPKQLRFGKDPPK